MGLERDKIQKDHLNLVKCYCTDGHCQHDITSWFVSCHFETSGLALGHSRHSFI